MLVQKTLVQSSAHRNTVLMVLERTLDRCLRAAADGPVRDVFVPLREMLPDDRALTWLAVT